jgi:hypothetical protein
MASSAAAGAAIAATSRFSSASVRNAVTKPHVRWALGGWAFFVAENAVLSENRTAIIGWLDGNENTYHALYGFGSTLATGSILYSYYHLTRKVPFAAAAASVQAISAGRVGLAWTCLSFGCAMALQALPKMQLPVDPAKNFSVRCPFDFSDRKSDSGVDVKVQGLERITRHPVRFFFVRMCRRFVRVALRIC